MNDFTTRDKEGKGFLIIAQNTEQYDYVNMAYALALSIKTTQKEHNKIAVAVDANTIIPDKYKYVFDYIIDIPWGDSASESTWKIENKWKYYYMTPFYETIVLDTDMVFTSDISAWWEMLNDHDLYFCTSPCTYKNQIITSDVFRKVFTLNELPNVYTAFMYFKQSMFCTEFFKLVQAIFECWEDFYWHFIDDSRPKYLSGDVAYALAVKILDIKEQVTGSTLIPTFVHMKSKLQNVGNLLDDEWEKSIPTYFTEDGQLFVGNFLQSLPFHYHRKEWLTDRVIEQLELNYARR